MEMVALMPISPLVQAVAPAVLGVVLILLYLQLVRLRRGYRRAFAHLNGVLKQRQETLATLTERVRGRLHEGETALLERVTLLRQQASREEIMAGGRIEGEVIGSLAAAHAALEEGVQALLSLLARHEAFQNDPTVVELRQEYANNQISLNYAQEAYNSAVLFFNTRRMAFPYLLVVAPLGFHAATPWPIQETAPPRPRRRPF